MATSDEIFDFLKTNPQFQDEINDLLKCGLCRSIMINPSFTSCGCDFCYDCISNHLQSSSQTCPVCETENIRSEVNIKISNRNKINQLKVKCSNNNCNIVESVSNVVEHMKHCDMQMMKCPISSIGCGNEEFSGLDKINCHCNTEVVKHNKILLDEIKNIKEVINSLKQDVEIKNNQINELNTNMENITKINNQYGNKFEEIEEKIGQFQPTEINMERELMEKLWNGLGRVNYGDFVWKLDKVSEKKQESRKGRKQFVESDVFYSHKHGYKLRFRCYPDGGGLLRGDLGLSFVILKGEFDKFLTWPCRRKIQLSLMNNETSEDEIVGHFHVDTDTSEHRYNKPTESQNSPCGDWNFISWSLLTKSPHLLKNDTISIKCSTSL